MAENGGDAVEVRYGKNEFDAAVSGMKVLRDALRQKERECAGLAQIIDEWHEVIDAIVSDQPDAVLRHQQRIQRLRGQFWAWANTAK
jgi:hypothetical protein